MLLSPLIANLVLQAMQELPGCFLKVECHLEKCVKIRNILHGCAIP